MVAGKAKETAPETTVPAEPVADVATTDAAGWVEPGDYSPALDSWDDLTEGAHEALGHDLAKDELLDALVGVPFMITHLTFRPGVPCTVETPLMAVGTHYAYVSAEIVVAPESELKRRRVDVENLPFDPLAQVVFNDGSTGIYRQLVEYLNTIGAIELPDGPEQGKKGESRYDLPPWFWSGLRAGTYTEADDSVEGDPSGTYEINVRLKCPRGLRRSEYDSPFGPAGTRYIG